MKPDPEVIQRFHRTLVEEINRDAPEQLDRPFTVAEIYQSLVPYRTHRDRIGVDMNGDYEDALLRLLAGEGEYLLLESDSARDRIRKELNGANPNTGLYREFAAVEVRLNPNKLPPDMERPRTPSDEGASRGAAAERPAVGFGDDPGGSSPAAGPAGAPSSPGPPAAGGKPAARTPTGPDKGKARSTASTKASGGPEAKAAPRDCPDCGKALPARENLRFCPHCGANPFHVECSACGEELERGWSFCIACGTPSQG